jgi:hypothetical protein
MTEISKEHPLVGTWITEDEDSDSAYVVKASRGRFVVSGFCRSDGERFRITQTRWDGLNLSFEALMPSTKWKSRHVFRLKKDGSVEHEITIWENWKKKDVTPGQLPEAWQVNTK